jgi:hypothetical protein
MKCHTSCAIALALACGSLLALAQTPLKPTMPSQRDPFLRERGAPVTAPKIAENVAGITVIVETYAMKPADALALISSAPDGAARYRQAQQWSAVGRARFENIMAGAARSNVRLMVESVDMVHAGTKFYAPLQPDEAAIASTFSPQQFGDRVELQPLIAPDFGSFHLNVSMEASQLLGVRGARVSSKMPPTPALDAERSQIVTSVTGRAGEPFLLGTLSRPAPIDSAQDAEMVVAFGRLIINRDQPEGAVAPGAQIDHFEHLISFYSVERGTARDLLTADSKPGAIHAAVQALVEKKQARFEHALMMASQSGVRAKNDENVVLSQPAAATFREVSASKPTPQLAEPLQAKLPYIPELVGRNMGLSVEIETVVGAPDAKAPGGPVSLDVSALIYWRQDRGTWKSGGGALYPETNAQESRKIESSYSCYPGVQTLVGTLNPPRMTGVNERKDSGRVWLAFLRPTPVKP